MDLHVLQPDHTATAVYGDYKQLLQSLNHQTKTLNEESSRQSIYYLLWLCTCVGENNVLHKHLRMISSHKRNSLQCYIYLLVPPLYTDLYKLQEHVNPDQIPSLQVPEDVPPYSPAEVTEYGHCVLYTLISLIT